LYSVTREQATVKVLHLGPEPSTRGGMGLSVQRLLRSPLAQRYDMTALATWRYGSEGFGRLLVFAQALGQMLVWCLRPGARVVHVHTAVRGSWYRKGACIVVAKLAGRPVVLQVRVGVGDMAGFAERLGPLRTAMFRWMFRLPDRVLSVSAAGAVELRERWGRSDTLVVTNPAPDVRARPPRADGPLNLLYVGGFWDRAKGWDVLRDALDGLLAAEPELTVTLAGPGEPTPEFQALLRSDGRVTWKGWLDAAQKADALGGADVFVLPSHSEGMPNAMLEAMSHGCAVVATRVGGVPDVLTDGEDGLMVPPGDGDALAAAALRVLRDPALRERLGRAAQERTERLSRDEVYGQLDRIYATLAATARP
jgi:glycosyltransferase involved in cell wall biosynthesis